MASLTDTARIELADSPAPPTALAPEPQARLRSGRETELLARARAGEQRALRELYTSHHGQVRAHLYRLLGDDPEVDDTLQLVFARAFNALDGFHGDAAFSTWLYRITANTTHNLLRSRFRRNRVKRAFEFFVQGAGAGVREHSVTARKEAQLLLAQLRPELREVFVLYHYEGLTLQEISGVLERPISTVGDHLSRARKELKALASP